MLLKSLVPKSVDWRHLYAIVARKSLMLGPAVGGCR